MTQASTVHGQPSLQFLGKPGTQVLAKAAQVSPTVQALPSSQGRVLPVETQVPARLQASVVHGLLSLQGVVGPGAHMPSLQVSPTLQLLPSLHAAPLAGANKQAPVALLQLSVVHGLLSLQAMVLPGAHRPSAHKSPTVHKLPSSQAGPLILRLRQVPKAATQESVVHARLSLQFVDDPPTHLPALQMSLTVHLLKSSHGKLLNGLLHTPVAVSQASSVHNRPSLHGFLTPGEHALNLHKSPMVQALPSLQARALAVLTQPVALAQVSVVQALPSLQFLIPLPTHLPRTQASIGVQASPSEHTVTIGL